MRTALVRPRLVALLLGLLPGLLLTGSEHLRVCLHSLMDLGDGCGSMAASEELPDCCGHVPVGPSVSSSAPCAGCCVELAAQATERTTPAPAGNAVAATFALPPPPALASCARPLVPAQPAPRPPSAASPPGRAPTPLRI